MKLYLVHCGFYDSELLDGIYESHVNLLVAAHDFDDARVRAKAHPDFARKRMHVDGLIEVEAVQGHRVELREDVLLAGESVLVSRKHRDLAPKAAPAMSASIS